MDLTRSVGGRLLRCGYTTGSCAAGAAGAAARFLLTGKPVQTVQLHTPKGLLLTLDIPECRMEGETALCAVRKDSGDDPDVTNGMMVYARVSRIASGIEINGGPGVGRVTKPGLDQPVGAAAINSTPRKMIGEAVTEAMQAAGYHGGLRVEISLPEGETLAKRTFNPRIGIVGGLSVIGTTGIVEPMSNQALIDTIRVELRQAAATGSKSVLLTPGNYGETFAQDKLGLTLHHHVSCSNFLGDAIDACLEFGFDRILLIGHIGKLVKLGIGLMNTHSAFGDGRMETLIACALAAGAEAPLLRRIADCISTDAALAVLDEGGVLNATMQVLGARIEANLRRKVPEDTRIEYICYTNTEPFAGVLCRSEHADDLIKFWRNET